MVIKRYFFEQLTTVMDSASKTREVVLMGDFNRRVEKDLKKKLIGQHEENIRNDNGIRLIKLCHQLD